MLRNKKEDIEWLEFELFADIPWLSHAIFLRHGGVSVGPYASLDIKGGGNALEARENCLRMQKIMGISLVAIADQVHGSAIAHVTPNEEKMGPCDALITKHNAIGLLIKHADCQAAIFVDVQQRVVANVHCGWRGNVANIYAKVIYEMGKQYGSRAENILVGISPSLGPNASEFIHYRTELPESFWPYQIKPMYFNLWEIARMQLERAGILPHHIQIASQCTYAHPEDFFSYRRDKITGSHATIVAIAPLPKNKPLFDKK